MEAREYSRVVRTEVHWQKTPEWDSEGGMDRDLISVTLCKWKFTLCCLNYAQIWQVLINLILLREKENPYHPPPLDILHFHVMLSTLECKGSDFLSLRVASFKSTHFQNCSWYKQEKSSPSKLHPTSQEDFILLTELLYLV